MPDMAAITGLDNDARGWILSFISGIACVIGASVVYVDLLIRKLPGKSDFHIQESNAFLACSLSLSFGVMMFSALYSMLPEAKEYLKGEDWGDRKAGLLLMSCFIAGFLGIQAVSRILHQHMPSHVVDCDHTHKDSLPIGDDGDVQNAHSGQPSSYHHDSHNSASTHSYHRRSRRPSPYEQAKIQSPARTADGTHAHNTATVSAAESTPLLRNPKQHHFGTIGLYRGRSRTAADAESVRRPSILEVQKRVMSFVKDTKSYCDEEGSCYGYSDPCGQECFKHISQRAVRASRSQTRLRTTMGSLYPPSQFPTSHETESDSAVTESPVSPMFRTSRATSRDAALLRPRMESLQKDDETSRNGSRGRNENTVDGRGRASDAATGRGNNDDDCQESCAASHADDLEAQSQQQQQHHHHVPTNAFMSIGLQTTIAITLHKLPEGFITYATNHANPALGFNIFMALFVHNITEGFTMCLPLYMALGSRWKAMAWSALLGGLSQPFGALLAALWFKLAHRTNVQPNAIVYAGLFAATAGIMVSVALQLFVEGLSLNHNRNLCIFFGFLGMAILGLSNALFASH